MITIQHSKAGWRVIEGERASRPLHPFMALFKGLAAAKAHDPAAPLFIAAGGSMRACDLATNDAPDCCLQCDLSHPGCPLRNAVMTAAFRPRPMKVA